jgi:hypothetical protein
MLTALAGIWIVCVVPVPRQVTPVHVQLKTALPDIGVAVTVSTELKG